MSQSDANSEYINDSFKIPDNNLLENSSALEEDFAKKFDFFNETYKSTNAFTGNTLHNELSKDLCQNLFGKSENINNKLFVIDNNPLTNPNNNIIKKKKGRKRKGDTTESEHTKFDCDNTIKKIKSIIINELFKFINKKIEEILGKDAGYGFVKKCLKKLCQDQIKNTKIDFNRDFLYKKLQNIFSENVTSRTTYYSNDWNKKLIIGLINDNDEKRSKYFKGLFNITFLDCLKYFRSENISNKYLEGFPKFSDYKRKNLNIDGEDYIEHLSEFLLNYEKFLFKSHPKKPKK